MSSKLDVHGRDGTLLPSVPRRAEDCPPCRADGDITAQGEEPPEESLLTASCPLPITNYKEIVLAHGSGGKLSHQLIEKMIAAAISQ